MTSCMRVAQQHLGTLPHRRTSKVARWREADLLQCCIVCEEAINLCGLAVHLCQQLVPACLQACHLPLQLLHCTTQQVRALLLTPETCGACVQLSAQNTRTRMNWLA